MRKLPVVTHYSCESKSCKRDWTAGMTSSLGEVMRLSKAKHTRRTSSLSRSYKKSEIDNRRELQELTFSNVLISISRSSCPVGIISEQKRYPAEHASENQKLEGTILRPTYPFFLSFLRARR